jgi:hypothetical protein
MEQVIHTYTTAIVDAEAGNVYLVEAWAAQRSDGLWEGWLKFVPDGNPGVLRTARETTQASLDAVIYWATGLEQVYLEGAFRRAALESHRPAA